MGGFELDELRDRGHLRDVDIRRAYRRAHPLALWFTGAIALIGFLTLVAPDTASNSPITVALPTWARKVFYCSWMLAGVTAHVGLWRARLDIEAAGLTLLSASLAAYVVSLLAITGVPLGSALFIGSLSAGCAHRAFYLTYQRRR